MIVDRVMLRISNETFCKRKRVATNTKRVSLSVVPSAVKEIAFHDQRCALREKGFYRRLIRDLADLHPQQTRSIAELQRFIASTQKFRIIEFVLRVLKLTDLCTQKSWIPMSGQTGCAPALRIKRYKFSSLLFTLTAHTLYSGILEIGSCADIVNWLTLRRPGQ